MDPPLPVLHPESLQPSASLLWFSQGLCEQTQGFKLQADQKDGASSTKLTGLTVVRTPISSLGVKELFLQGRAAAICTRDH